jgi:hypothetical protein
VPAHVHHLENGGAALGGRREEARAQQMPRKKLWIEADAFGMNFHDLGDAVRR